MNLEDYLLNIDELDWGKLFKEWKWLMRPGTKVQPWLMNAFGDLFWFDDQGRVCLLNVNEGTTGVAAESKNAFLSLLEDEDRASNWLLLPLVDELVTFQVKAKLGQCYGFKLLPVLGGEYVVSNIYIASIAKYWAFCGDVHRQLDGVPDGSDVEIEFTERKKG